MKGGKGKKDVSALPAPLQKAQTWSSINSDSAKLPGVNNSLTSPLAKEVYEKVKNATETGKVHSAAELLGKAPHMVKSASELLSPKAIPQKKPILGVKTDTIKPKPEKEEDPAKAQELADQD